VTHDARSAAGFSLTELLVAMLVTLLVSGAVFGLLSAGQSAFKREPELTDRQQNIRLAMDLIQRDLATAGMGLGGLDQVFTPNLNGLGAAATPSGQTNDALEMVGATGECPEARVGAFTATTVTTSFPLPRCFGANGAVAVDMGGGVFHWGMARNMTQDGTLVSFPNPQPPNAHLPGFAAMPVSVTRLQFVRYQIAPDVTDNGLPCLWRSDTGGFDPATGAPVAAPGAAAWQLVARGIEDLQVEYLDGNSPPAGPHIWQNQPPVSTLNNWTTLVRQVRISLSARVTQANLAGESTAGGGAPNAVRGQLSTVVTPRAAFHELQMCTGATLAPVTACPPVNHIQ
jgi:type II secretory pathway pseudopilin PulG